MDNIHIDPTLITALVEKRRPETHMYMGEITVTLEGCGGIMGYAH
jgi:hypothetical protein